MATPRVMAGLVVMLLALGGCGSHVTTMTFVDTTDGGSPAPVEAAVVVEGFPADFSVVSVAVEGTTGWVLGAGEDAGIWRVPASGSPKKVVDRAGFEGLEEGGLTIAAFNGGVVLLGQRCVMDKVAGAECVKSTGLAEFFDTHGTLAHTTTLWKDQVAQAGGTAPSLLSVDESRLWLAGGDQLYSVDTTGKITETVPRTMGMSPCMSGGTLYATNWDTPADLIQPDGEVPGAATGSLPVGPVSIGEWTGGKWTEVADSATSAGGPAPQLTCGNEGIMAWNAGELAAIWQPGKGWTTVANADAPAPTAKSNEGVGYLVTRSGVVQRQDPHTGAFTDIGLTLAAGADQPKRTDALRVAERGQSVFACGDSVTGASGESVSHSYLCGFAALGT